MMNLSEATFSHKRVLLRCDLNVPLDAEGNLLDEARIKAVWPTIAWLLERQCSILLLTHFRDPKEPNPRDSTQQLLPHLCRIWGRPVRFLPLSREGNPPSLATTLAIERGVLFPEAIDLIGGDTLLPGEIGLLENLRFLPGEKRNDPELGPALAQWGDVFVNDAFSVSHRNHASILQLPHYLPTYRGLHFADEVRALSHPYPHPALLILGGAKDKSRYAPLLAPKVEGIFIAGAQIRKFLPGEYPSDSSEQFSPTTLAGTSILPVDVRTENNIPPTDMHAKTYILPVDVRTENGIYPTHAPSAEGTLRGMAALDIGPKAEEQLRTLIPQFKTVLWNGLLGKAEDPAYAQGTQALVECLIQHPDIYLMVGGGDTLRFLPPGRAQHASTAGGAFLAFLTGSREHFPGLF